MNALGKIKKTIMACPECHHEIDVSIENDSDGILICPVCSKKLRFSKNPEAASDVRESSAWSRNEEINKAQGKRCHGFDEELFLCGVIGISIGTFAPSINLWQTFVGAFLTTFFGVGLSSRHYRKYVYACKKLGIEESQPLYWILTTLKNSLFILTFLALVKGFNMASSGVSF